MWYTVQTVKAVYALMLGLEEEASIHVGALGKIRFPPGIYVYTGSAMNSVEKRLGRHLSGAGKKHWHIDYLSSAAEPVDYLVLPESSEFECLLAKAVSRVGEPVNGFGCSDCGCKSHLFRLD